MTEQFVCAVYQMNFQFSTYRGRMEALLVKAVSANSEIDSAGEWLLESILLILGALDLRIKRSCRQP